MLDEVTDPGANTGTTTNSSDAAVTFLSDAAPGTTSCNLTSQAAGCRGLKITKTSGLVTKIERVVGGAVPAWKTVAVYTYTGQQLTEVCNPSLKSQPADPTSAPSTRTPRSTGAPSSRRSPRTTRSRGSSRYDSAGRLVTVQRLLDGSTTDHATWTAKYDLSLDQAGIPQSTPRPRRTGARPSSRRASRPCGARTAFPGRHPTATDMSYAQVYWFNEPGAVTNAGVNNGSAWLVDTTWYDEKQRPVQTLDGASWAQVQTLPTADRPAAAYKASAITIYNATLDRAEDEYGPVHQATLEDGTIGSYRAHAAYQYDDEVSAAVADGRPTLPAGQTSWNMVIDTTTSAANPDLTGVFDPQLVRNVYSPVQAGDGSGWDYGMPTQVKTQLAGGAWSTEVNRIDTEGRTVEARQPGGTGTDAHSTLFTYYTSDAASGDPGLQQPTQARWAGLQERTCR